MVDHPRQPKPRGRPRQAASSDPAPEPVSRPIDAEEGPGERVAKALARAGVASRREVERLIAEGRVALNGRVLDTPAVKVRAADILTVNGEVVGAAEPTRVWRYHKPVGLVTSHNDPHGRPTVFEHLPPAMPRVISVGRLDLNSEGLLLLTNDGALTRALELPSNGWVRQYRARAYGRCDQAMLDRLKQGITVEGVAYGPIEARLDKAQRRSSDEPGGKDLHGPANVWISLSLTEGKNREVRRVLESLGLKVNRLLRLAYGPFALGTLESGAVEEVGPRVIRELLADFIASQNLPTGVRAATAPASSSPRRRTTSAKAPREPRHQASAAPPSGGRPRPLRPKARDVASSAPAVAKRADPVGPTSAGAGDAQKPVYKPGWAKPKRKVSPHAPKRSAAKSEGDSTLRAPNGPGAKAVRAPRAEASSRRSGALRRGAPKGGGKAPRG